MRRSGSGSWRASTIRSSSSVHSRPCRRHVSLAPEHIAHPVVFVRVVREPDQKKDVRARFRWPSDGVSQLAEGQLFDLDQVWAAAQVLRPLGLRVFGHVQLSGPGNISRVTWGKPWQVGVAGFRQLLLGEFGIKAHAHLVDGRRTKDARRGKVHHR